MREVFVNLAERSYVITIGAGVLERLGRVVTSDRKPTSVAVVTNPIVGRYYAEMAMDSLEQAGVNAILVTLPAGERSKTLGTVRRIYDALLEMKMDRAGAIVALGGGVIGDMAGSPPRHICAGSISTRFRRRCWRRWMPAWVGRPAWTCRRARTWSARSTNPGPCS